MLGVDFSMKKKSLRELRSEIARIDARILEEIEKRKRLAELVADRKISNKTPLRDKAVEAEVYKRNLAFGKKLRLEDSFVSKITKLLITQSVCWQREKLTSLRGVGSRERHHRKQKRRNCSHL